MEYKLLSPKVKIPALGLGTWKMGGGMTAGKSQDKKYIDAIEYAVQKGLTHIDTAEIYGAGHAEELVGKTIKNFKRDKLFITTKVSPQHLFLQRQILTSAKNSLKRLKTDYIDLYLIHWPNPIASMKMVMTTFDKLVSEGMVRYIGVSNFSVRQFENAQKYTQNKIVTNQVEYSLLERDPEIELLDYCQKEGIILTAYTPLSSGRLTQWGSFEALDKIAKKYNKTQAQVALRWLIEKTNVITIPKASSKNHIDEILGALDWELKKEDSDFLDKEF
jgi:diketogulonate reductase-like aldo/keto reductase